MLESMKKRRGGRVLGDGVANVIKLRKTKKNFTSEEHEEKTGFLHKPLRELRALRGEKLLS
ncbi:MAG: hypothetical protein IPQ05_11160 [Leptospiraceae bacterium]|nr:hypothetical protein [Leptospiraceae bacterium]